VFLLPSCFPLSFEGSSPALLVTREVLRNRLVGVLLRQSYSAPFTEFRDPQKVSRNGNLHHRLSCQAASLVHTLSHSL
jgi:hypothetical protein